MTIPGFPNSGNAAGQQSAAAAQRAAAAAQQASQAAGQSLDAHRAAHQSMSDAAGRARHYPSTGGRRVLPRVVLLVLVVLVLVFARDYVAGLLAHVQGWLESVAP